MKLDKYLKNNEVSQADFARRVGVTRHHISQIVNNLRNPSLELATIIEQATKGEVSMKDLFNVKVPSRLRSIKRKKIEKGNP